MHNELPEGFKAIAEAMEMIASFVSSYRISLERQGVDSSEAVELAVAFQSQLIQSFILNSIKAQQKESPGDADS